MIIYELRCNQGHTFEGWFASRPEFEKQHAAKLVTCPTCGSADTQVKPSSVAVVSRETKDQPMHEHGELSPLAALRMVNAYVERHFDDVGARFADVALKIHHGEEEKRNIRGTTTEREEEALREEGVQFMKIPFLKFDG